MGVVVQEAAEHLDLVLCTRRNLRGDRVVGQTRPQAREAVLHRPVVLITPGPGTRQPPVHPEEQLRNVDLNVARLTVNQQVVSVDYKLIVDDLKNETSRRTIDLDEHTIAMLRRHRRQQLEELMASGRRGDDGFVIAKPDDSPVHPDLISQTFERTVAHLDVPRIRLHDLRHTHATILLQQNVHPKVVSERLGHSSIAFTMTVYQHVMPGMQAKAAATFGAAVFGE